MKPSFQISNDGCKDEKYWERRRKNNLAAKRSRDARRAKENQVWNAHSFNDPYFASL